jgi:prepilin-type N-terminal cleavage/methylation domain-containing protein
MRLMHGLSLLRVRRQTLSRGRSHFRCSHHWAFTLMEVLMAMAVVGVTVMALYAAFSWGISVVQRARENSCATQVLLQKTESLRLYTWNQITSNGFIPTNFTAPYPLGNTNNPMFWYQGTVTLSNPPLAATYSNDIKQASIVLTWERSGLTQRREMSTFVARNGLQSYFP